MFSLQSGEGVTFTEEDSKCIGFTPWFSQLFHDKYTVSVQRYTPLHCRYTPIWSGYPQKWILSQHVDTGPKTLMNKVSLDMQSCLLRHGQRIARAGIAYHVTQNVLQLIWLNVWQTAGNSKDFLVLTEHFHWKMSGRLARIIFLARHLYKLSLTGHSVWPARTP